MVTLIGYLLGLVTNPAIALVRRVTAAGQLKDLGHAGDIPAQYQNLIPTKTADGQTVLIQREKPEHTTVMWWVDLMIDHRIVTLVLLAIVVIWIRHKLRKHRRGKTIDRLGHRLDVLGSTR